MTAALKPKVQEFIFGDGDVAVGVRVRGRGLSLYVEQGCRR